MERRRRKNDAAAKKAKQTVLEELYQNDVEDQVRISPFQVSQNQQELSQRVRATEVDSDGEPSKKKLKGGLNPPIAKNVGSILRKHRKSWEAEMLERGELQYIVWMGDRYDKKKGGIHITLSHIRPADDWRFFGIMLDPSKAIQEELRHLHKRGRLHKDMLETPESGSQRKATICLHQGGDEAPIQNRSLCTVGVTFTQEPSSDRDVFTSSLGSGYVPMAMWYGSESWTLQVYKLLNFSLSTLYNTPITFLPSGVHISVSPFGTALADGKYLNCTCGVVLGNSAQRCPCCTVDKDDWVRVLFEPKKFQLLTVHQLALNYLSTLFRILDLTRDRSELKNPLSITAARELRVYETRTKHGSLRFPVQFESNAVAQQELVVDLGKIHFGLGDYETWTAEEKEAVEVRPPISHN
jgi:hypothetical protein